MVLRKKLTVLLATVMMLGVMSAAPVMVPGVLSAAPAFAASENGNKSDDGPDANQGGGQEHIRNAHPPKGGGEKHGGGDGDNGGGND